MRPISSKIIDKIMCLIGFTWFVFVLGFIGVAIYLFFRATFGVT